MPDASSKGHEEKLLPWAIYNAVRRTKAQELGNLRELLQKHRINIHESIKETWSN
jgi:hypothetical protein